MSKQVEFFFDVGSPATYLAWTQLPRLIRDTGAVLHWRPFLLGGVFKATGNQTPAAIPAKGRYMIADLSRFAQRYEVELAFSPHFPINTLALMRGATALLGTPQFDDYLRAVFEGIWVTQQDLGDPPVVMRVLSEAGIDPAQFRERIEDPATKQHLKENTEEAVRRGVFGAPTFFVGEEMFFGQDRLDFVAEALGG